MMKKWDPIRIQGVRQNPLLFYSIDYFNTLSILELQFVSVGSTKEGWTLVRPIAPLVRPVGRIGFPIVRRNIQTQ